MIESLLLTAARILTFQQRQALTGATGFFFERGDRLFLVTSRHVLIDAASAHFPDRIEIDLHIDPTNIARSTGFSIPLYGGSTALWRQGRDAGGEVDIAAIEIQRSALPESAVYRAFTESHLHKPPDQIEVGTSILVVGYPLGFYDTLHHLPVVRHAVIASSFGLRFQGQGYFLTDSRTHRGSSGAPVVMRRPQPPDSEAGALPWMLLGIHSSRVDIGTRDVSLDEALGLNCAWYADMLLTLTED